MKTLRIAADRVRVQAECDDLAVTPLALTFLSAEGRPYLRPIDFVSAEEIRGIKHWVIETAQAMDAEWGANPVLPSFIRAVGFDLCVLLETLKVADLVLSKLWSSGAFTNVQVRPHPVWNRMLEYPLSSYGYADLLSDEGWCRTRTIEVRFEATPIKYRDGFYKGAGGDTVRQLAADSRRRAAGWMAYILAKATGSGAMSPRLIVVPHKDVSEMLTYPGAVTLERYLATLPTRKSNVKAVASQLMESVDRWFSDATPALNRLGTLKNIVRQRLRGFVRVREDLIQTYVKTRDAVRDQVPVMLLPSSGGCSPDAWAAMALQEKGGVVASGQHGGAYGNLNCPYFVFSDCRFDYFFTYGSPATSPIYEFAKAHGRAQWIAAGSPILGAVRRKNGPPPATVRKVLYVMNLSVAFYSANFPWEHILSQLKTLELLTGYATAYSIHVKEEQTGAVRREDYPGLHFITGSPKDVLHEYDLLILESGMSTAVLEGASTNKFLVVFTGSEWEDVSSRSLDLLSRRAECFHRWEDFLPGLARILDNPAKHLNPMKLKSDEFVEAYCGPVSAEQYVGTIRHALSLS